MVTVIAVVATWFVMQYVKKGVEVEDSWAEELIWPTDPIQAIRG